MPRHDPQLIRWCNEDLSLPSYIQPDTVEEQFSNGYLYGCIIYNIAPIMNIRLPDNYLKSFIQNDNTTATKVSNFDTVRQGLRLLNLSIDSNRITAICTEQRGAATGLLFQLKSAFDIATGAVPSQNLPSSSTSTLLTASAFGVTTKPSSSSSSTRLRLAETVRDAPLVNQYLLAGMNPKQIAMALHLSRFEEFRIATERKAALLDAEEDSHHLQDIRSQQIAQAQKTQTHRAWGEDFEATNKELHELEMNRMQDQERTDLAYELTMMEKRRILENNERVRSKYDAQSNINKFEKNMRKMGLNPYGNNNNTALLATANSKDKLTSSKASTDGKEDTQSSTALSSIVTADQAHANYIHTSTGDVLKRGILGGVSTHTISHLAPRPLSRIADALFSHTHPYIDEVTRSHALTSMDTLAPGTTPLLTTFDASLSAQSQQKETPQEYLERMTVSFAVGFRSRDATVYNEELSNRIKEERNARRDKATRGRLMNSFQEKAAAAVEGRAAQDAEIVRLVEEARIQRTEAEATAARKFAKQERVTAGIEWAKRQEEKLDARFQERVNRDRVRLEQERTLRLEEEAPAREARMKARAEIEANRRTANIEIVKDTIELLMDVALDVADKLEVAKETYGPDSIEAKGIVPSEWRSIKKSFVDGSIGTNRIIATIAQAREQVENGGKAMGLPTLSVAPDGLTAWGIVLGGNRVAGTSLSVTDATKVSPSAFFESQPPLPADDITTLLDYCDVHDWEAARGAWSLPKDEKDGAGSRGGSPLHSRPTSRRASRSSSPMSLPNVPSNDTVLSSSVTIKNYSSSWMVDTTVKNETAAQSLLTDFLTTFPSTDQQTTVTLPFIPFTLPSPLRIVTSHQGIALPHSPVVSALARRFRMLHITALDIILCACFVFDDENRRLLDKSYGVPNHPIAALALGPLVTHPSIHAIVQIWNQNHHTPTTIDDTKLFFADFTYQSDKEKQEIWNHLYALGSTVAVYLSLIQRGSIRQRPLPVSSPSIGGLVLADTVIPPAKSRRGSTASVNGGNSMDGVPVPDPNVFVSPPLPENIDQAYSVKDDHYRAALHDASCTDPLSLVQSILQTRQAILDAQKAIANGESVPNSAVVNAVNDPKAAKAADKGKDAKDTKKDKNAVVETPPPSPVVEIHPYLLQNILSSTYFAEGLSIYIQQAERYVTNLRTKYTSTSLGGYNGWIMDNLLVSSPMHVVAIEYAVRGSLLWTPVTAPSGEENDVSDGGNSRNVRFESTVSPYVPTEWDGKSLSSLLQCMVNGTFKLPNIGKDAIERWDIAAAAAKLESEKIAAAEALAAQQAAEAALNPPPMKTPSNSRPGSQAASKPSSAASTKKPGSAKTAAIDANANALIPPPRPAAEALAAMGPRPLLSCSIDIVLSVPTLPLVASSYLVDNDTHDIYMDGLVGLPVPNDTASSPLVVPLPNEPKEGTTGVPTAESEVTVPAPTGSRPNTGSKAKPPVSKGKTEEPPVNAPPSPLSVLSTLLFLPKMQLLLPLATLSSSLESYTNASHSFVSSWINLGVQKGYATITSVEDGKQDSFDTVTASCEVVLEYLSQAYTTTTLTMNQKILLSLSRGVSMDIRLLQNTLRAYRTCNNAYNDTATYLLSRIREITQHTRSHIRRLARSFLRLLRGLPDASIPLTYLSGLPVVPSSVEQLTNTMRTTRIRAAEAEAMKSNYRNQSKNGSNDDDTDSGYGKYEKRPLVPMPSKTSHLHRRDTVQVTDVGIITPELRRLAEKVAGLDIKDSMHDTKYIEALCQEADEAAANFWSSMERRRDAAVDYLDALRNDGWILDIQCIIHSLTSALVHIATRRTQDSAAFVVMVEEQMLLPVQEYYSKVTDRIRNVHCTHPADYSLNITLNSITEKKNNKDESKTVDVVSTEPSVTLDILPSVLHNVSRIPSYHDILVQAQSSLRTLLHDSLSSSASSRASATMAVSRAWRTILGTTYGCYRLHTNIQRGHSEAINWCDRSVHIWLQRRDNAVKQIIQRIQTVLRAGANPVLYETRILDEKRQAKLHMLATTQRNSTMVALSDQRGNITAGSSNALTESRHSTANMGTLSRSVSAGKVAVSSTDGARGITLPKLSPIDFIIPNDDGIAEIYGWIELPEKEDLLTVSGSDGTKAGTNGKTSSGTTFGPLTGPVFWDGPQVSVNFVNYRFDENNNNSSRDSFGDLYNMNQHSAVSGDSSSSFLPPHPSTLSEAISEAEAILARFGTAVNRPLRSSPDNGMNSSSASSATLALTMSRQAKEVEKSLTSTVVLPPSIKAQQILTESPTGYAAVSQIMECTHPQLRLTGKGILAVTRAFMDIVMYSESNNPSAASSLPNTREGMSTGRSNGSGNNQVKVPALALPNSSTFHTSNEENSNQAASNASRTLTNVFIQAMHNLSEEFGSTDAAFEHIPSAWLQAPSSVWLFFTRTYARDTIASLTNNNTVTYTWDIITIRRLIIALLFTRLRNVPTIDQLILLRRNLTRVDDDNDGYLTQAQYLNSLLFFETTMERATETLLRQDKDRVIANKAATAAGKTVTTTNNLEKHYVPKTVRTVSYDKPGNNSSSTYSSGTPGSMPTMTVSPEAAVAQGGARDMDNVLRQTLLSLTPSNRFLDAACLREILWLLYTTDKNNNKNNNNKGHYQRLDIYALLFDLCTDPRTTHATAIPLTGGMGVADGKTSFPSGHNSLHNYRRSSLEQLGIFSSTSHNNGLINPTLPSLGDNCIAGASPSISAHAGWHSYHPSLRGSSSSSTSSSSSLSPSSSSGVGSHHALSVPGIPRIPGLLKAFLLIADVENIVRDEFNEGRKHPLYIGVPLRSFYLLLAYSLGINSSMPLLNTSIIDIATVQQQLLDIRSVDFSGQEYSVFQSLITYTSSNMHTTTATNGGGITIDKLVTCAETVLNSNTKDKDSIEYMVGTTLLLWFYTLPFGICNVGNPCDTVPLEM